MRIYPLVLASPARVRNGSVNLPKLPKVMAGLIYLGMRREAILPEHGGMRAPSSPRSNAFVDHIVIFLTVVIVIF